MVESSDPRVRAFHALCAHVLAGGDVEDHEGSILDCKEDPSRRGSQGQISDGQAQSDLTAKTVADAVACFACAGGGVVVVGVDDKKTGAEAFIGTPVDVAWLTNRVRQLLGVEVHVEKHDVVGQRVVTVNVDASPLPVSDTSKRYRRRQGRDCQDMSPAELGSFTVNRATADWSAARSAFSVADTDPAAVAQLRIWLNAAGETSRAELAELDDAAMLRAVGLAEADGTLNRAGELLTVTLPDREPLIDLSCRPAPGAETTKRVDPAERPVAVVLAAVEEAVEDRMPTYPHQAGLVVGQIPAVPKLAVREAIVNAIMHRNWSVAGPVRVELDGTLLAVTSPGGFVAGVTEETVITAPPRTRNATLAGAMRALRLAEQEGSGVDRMFRETVRVGLPTPQIHELPGAAAIRCALVGGEPDVAVMGVVGSLGAPNDHDVDILLVLDALEKHPTINATRLQPIIQKSHPEAISALQRARAAGLVLATPRDGHYRLADVHRQALATRLGYLRRTQDDYERVIADVLAAHGEVRARDLIELCGVGAVTASRALAAAVGNGVVEKRPNRDAVGAGVFYVETT